jgi:hypothetical protein
VSWKKKEVKKKEFVVILFPKLVLRCERKIFLKKRNEHLMFARIFLDVSVNLDWPLHLQIGASFYENLDCQVYKK